MKSIKFSNDYTKLPIIWENTQAILIGVYLTNNEWIRKTIPQFYEYDTLTRDDKRYQFYFNKCIILIFIHINSGVPFTTIRNFKEDKFYYYNNSIGDTFILKKGEI